MSVFSWKFLSLGHGLMGLMLAMAGVGIILTIERLLFFKQFSIDAAIFLDGIRNLVHNRKIGEAIDLCEREGSPVANVVRAALIGAGLPSPELTAHVKSAALLEIPRCEQRISPLRTIAKLAPILGLMGVVLAFFNAFRNLQNEGVSYSSSRIFSEEIMAATLLITVSLAISVFSNLAYNFLYGKVKEMVYQLEWVYNEILQIIFRGND
ncbi:MAG: MotA/TolQ/ExbB proton channel family protein [Puniceicoccales bacterium]|jgi:biopolymer transport protein ExbB|nr:MotA/TolQ/ExbB proton channel family protein [Puniceicoccales bacterium]